MLFKNIILTRPNNFNKLLSRYFYNPVLKIKIKGDKNNSGRNNLGKITSYHKGGGHKQRYRTIDFLKLRGSIGIIMSIEYDPNRTARIASIYDILSKDYFYILAPHKLKVGNIIKTGKFASLKLGHHLPLKEIPSGSFIHNINISPKTKGILTRAAGTFSQLIEKNLKSAVIKLSSGKVVMVPLDCLATLGKLSNPDHFLKQKKKAGRSRWLNIRPTVRGVAMNPIDHPHGGGEGKTSKRKAPLTPWGKLVNRGSTSKSKNRFKVIT